MVSKYVSKADGQWFKFDLSTTSVKSILALDILALDMRFLDRPSETQTVVGSAWKYTNG